MLSKDFKRIKTSLRNINVNFIRLNVSISWLHLSYVLMIKEFSIMIWHLIPVWNCIEYSSQKPFEDCAFFKQSLELNWMTRRSSHIVLIIIVLGRSSSEYYAIRPCLSNLVFLPLSLHFLYIHWNDPLLIMFLLEQKLQNHY